MKTIVTHTSPDLDAITSVWLIKRFLKGWEDAQVKYVPAGERLSGDKSLRAASDARQGLSRFQTGSRSLSESRQPSFDLKDSTPASTFSSLAATQTLSPIEKIGGDEVIHVDTGLGPLDHHQTPSDKVSAASVTWDFIKIQNSEFKIQNSEKIKSKTEAIDRIVRVIVDIDHFKEVFWKDPEADHYEFNLIGILDGLKLLKPDQDEYYTEFVMEALDALLHEFENRIWAEKEIKENGTVFKTRYGRGIGFESINDTVIKLAQKMGYVLVVRKDPRKGYVRIKSLPTTKDVDIDLTLAYEQLRKMDPEATWFLHVGRKMLLNGTAKNPKMKPSKLPLSDIIKVLKSV